AGPASHDLFVEGDAVKHDSSPWQLRLLLGVFYHVAGILAAGRTHLFHVAHSNAIMAATTSLPRTWLPYGNCSTNAAWSLATSSTAGRTRRGRKTCLRGRRANHVVPFSVPSRNGGRTGSPRIMRRCSSQCWRNSFK